MKKIGKGYFYTVYDLGNGRVLKQQKSKGELLRHVFLINGLLLPHAFTEYKRAIKTLPLIAQTYSKIRERIMNTSLLGNPLFLRGIDYEQDKVEILHDALKSATYDEHATLSRHTSF